MKILKKYWSHLALLVAIIILCLSVRQCQINNSATTLLNEATDSVRYYKLKDGRSAAQIKTNEVTIDELKEYGGKLGFDNEQLKKQVGKLSNLVAHYKGKAGMRDTITLTLMDTVIAEVDGTDDFEHKFAWSNKYLFLDGVINDGKLSLSYNYETEFSVTAYYKRRGLFKRDLLTDVVFTDPHMKTTEFKGFVVKEPKKVFWNTGLGRFLIGFGAGALTYSAVKK